MDTPLVQFDFQSADRPAAQLEAALVHGLRLLGAVEDFAMQLSSLGDIELDPLIGPEIDQAYLRAAASLYLTSELESAGLLPAVELLAGLFRTGALQIDLGPAAGMLNRFWRERRERLTPQERAAIFAHAFGREAGPGLAENGPNENFERLLAGLCGALHRMQKQPLLNQPPGPRQQARLFTAAQALAVNLASRSGEITRFLCCRR